MVTIIQISPTVPSAALSPENAEGENAPKKPIKAKNTT